MKKEFNKKIDLYGSSRDIDQAYEVLKQFDFPDNEKESRLFLQNVIDECNLKADILYEGNTVYPYLRIIRDFKRALNSKPCKDSEYGSGEYDLTDYLYKFFSLSCGSIAHFNKYGWIGTYPEKIDLCRFIFNNEFGQDIESHQPSWHSDAIKIAKELKNIAKIYINKYDCSIKKYAKIGA